MRTMKLFAVVLASLITTVSLTESTYAGDLASSAKRYLHMSERGNTRTLTKMLGINPRRTPWCGAFVTFVVKKAGHKAPSASNMARSWTRYGKRVSRPRRGDIVVLRTKSQYHVSIVESVSASSITAVGGNQHDRVQVSRYKRSRVVAFRRG